MLKIGNVNVSSNVFLAPMAGVTDLPFRRLCRSFGAGLTTSEMLISDTSLWHTRKSQTRLALDPQEQPVSMQIAGSDPAQLAEAAQACVERGAQLVDINMGCPAKKVCKKRAGSALLADEPLVTQILTSVVNSVGVPVTLKTRTGTDPDSKNCVRIAKIAEESGIKALAIHGRTRACRFGGEAEYDTIRSVVNAISIPVIANGDIQCPKKAKHVMEHTGASAIMIGRAALGQPWIFHEISQILNGAKINFAPALAEKRQIIVEHIEHLHAFYGSVQGVRFARKHFGWYCDKLADGQNAKKIFNKIDSAEQQLAEINSYFQRLKIYEEQAA